MLFPRKVRDVSFACFHPRKASTIVLVAVEDDVPGAKAIKRPNIFIMHNKKSVCVSSAVTSRSTIKKKRKGKKEAEREGRRGELS